jgi:hypothetical protein
MKKNILNIRLILVVCLSAALLMGASAKPTPTWEQVNEDGFGDFLNLQLPALTEFGGYLYSGVWHWDVVSWSPYAQIWRTADGETWEMVYDAPGNGTAALIAYKDDIYAGSWVEGRVWRSHNGLDWEDVPIDLGDSTLDTAHFAVFKNALYLSSWNGPAGTEIWKTTDGTHWNRFGDVQNGNPNNSGAIASAEFKGQLYWGVYNWVDGAQIWRTDGDTIETIMTGGFGSPVEVVSSLARFGDYLYAGAWIDGDASQTQVWRTKNGMEWELVKHIDGTGSTSALEVVENQLVLVAENGDTGLEAWRTLNGVDWEQIASGGFGDPNNTWSFFDNAATVFRGKLYVATINWWTGGEVWRLCLEDCKK